METLIDFFITIDIVSLVIVIILPGIILAGCIATVFNKKLKGE